MHLLVPAELDLDLYLAARNLPRIDVVDIAGIDPVSLIEFNNIIMNVAAIKKFEEAFV